MTESPARKPIILFVDDTKMLADEFPILLRRAGYSVLTAVNVREAMAWIESETHLDLAILDMQLPLDGCESIGIAETDGGNLAGLVLAQELRRKFKRTPIIFWTTAYSRTLRSRIQTIGNARLLPKAIAPSVVLDMVQECLDGIQSGKRPTAFIVHGHDHTSMLQLKDFLQNRMRFPPPVVLREMESTGLTLIEKLEAYVLTIDVVFVLLTPDDRVASSGGESVKSMRARQNVIFELGFFMGSLGRTSGRLIILHKQPVEIPSDIKGLVTIDISRGFDEAGMEIIRELSEWA